MTRRLRTLTVMSLLVIFSLSYVSSVHAAPGPDFQVSSSPSSFIVHQGSSNSTNVILHSVNNFAGTLTLSTGTLPNGYSASWNPGNMVTLTANNTATVTLRFFVSSTAPLRTSAIMVTASNSTTSHFTFLFVTVVPPPQYDLSVSVNPGALNLRPGLSGDSTVVVSSINGFNGTVQLTATVAPTGLTLSFSSVNITVTPTTPGTSTLTISMPSTATDQAYSVTIYASNGTITRSGSVTINPPATTPPLFNITLQTGLYIVIAVTVLAVVAVVVRHSRRSPMN